MHFNYSNPDLIQRFVNENCSSYILNSIKNISFTICCKIFQYPNKVQSVRLMLCTIYKINQEDFTKEIEPFLFQTEPINHEEFKNKEREYKHLNATNKTTINKM